MIAAPLALLLFASGPSALPHARFPAASASDVSGRLASQCLDRGHAVIESTVNSVTCEIRLGTAGSIAAGLMVGSRSSTRPKNMVRFVIVQAGPDVRVQARQWLEAVSAFGQTRAEPLTDPALNARLQQSLYDAGGQPD